MGEPLPNEQWRSQTRFTAIFGGAENSPNDLLKSGMTRAFTEVSCAGGSHPLRRFEGPTRGHHLAADEPGVARSSLPSGLAFDRQLLSSTLQKIEPKPGGNGATSVPGDGRKSVPRSTDQRSDLAEGRPELFGNDRARQARPDEGRRNRLSSRIPAPGGAAPVSPAALIRRGKLSAGLRTWRGWGQFLL